MKPFVLACFLLLSLEIFASDQIWSTTHLDVRYKEGQTTLTEAQTVGIKAELFYEALEAYLEQSPNHRIIISLEGNRGDDPKHRWPYVDTTCGWIHLFRFPEDSYSYETGLSHELVHAYRFEHLSQIRPTPAFVFLEEGIAEYLSNKIDPKKFMFPNYGAELDIAAGQWIFYGLDIPLTTLLNEQYQLRPKCIAQSYTQQPSFIQFLEMELGATVIRTLAYAKDIFNEQSFTPYFGRPFSEMSARWKSSLLESFLRIPNHTALGNRWRNETPISNMYICRKNTDF